MRGVTPQKLEILQAVADGKNYRDIASSRGTTEQVVKNQMVRILRELQAEEPCNRGRNRYPPWIDRLGICLR
jgi:DNA-binding NarL/FixJ family response regulator